MKSKWMAAVCMMSAFVIAGCAGNDAATNDVADRIEESLEQANIQDVSVNQDAEKGVVTLSGEVSSEADKERAEAIAKTAAPSDVIANEIRVLPAGMESRADDVVDDLDAAIERNLDAEFTKANIDDVSHEVNTGVVTLTGEVASAAERARIEKMAAAVPNVKQVVNKLEIANETDRTADRPTTGARPAGEPIQPEPTPAR